jgi:hypothetical protein
MNKSVTTVVQYVKISSLILIIVTKKKTNCSNIDNNWEQSRRRMYQMCLGDNVTISTIVLRFIAYLQSSSMYICES